MTRHTITPAQLRAGSRCGISTNSKPKSKRRLAFVQETYAKPMYITFLRSISLPYPFLLEDLEQLPPKKFLHCNENLIYVFPEMKLYDVRASFVSNSYLHVSLSDLYILRIVLPIWLQQNCSKTHECGWETEHYNSVLEITRLRSFISGNT